MSRSEPEEGAVGQARDARPGREGSPAEAPAPASPALGWSGEVAAPRSEAGEASKLRERLRVLLFARVLVVSVFLAGAGAIHLGRSIDSLTTINTATFVVIALAYAGTLFSAMAVGRAEPLRPFAMVQMIFDVVLVSGGIGLAGGAESPFVLLYALAIANAAGLLLMRGAVVTAVASSLSYAVLILWPIAFAGIPVNVARLIVAPIALATVCLMVAAVMIGSLARRLYVAEQELEERQAEVQRLDRLQRAMANHLDSAVLLVDTAGRVRSANAAAQQILRLSVAEMLGREINWLVPLLATGEQEQAGGTARLPSSDNIECAYRAPDGSDRRLRVKRAPLADTYSNAIGELVILQDVTRLLELESQATEREELEATAEPFLAPETDEDERDGLIGVCSAMRAVSKLIDKVSQADATVLVLGESGTGKELVARAIHQRSARSTGPFVVVNCGAIPENLIESELFGHVRGAFTGAIADRPGLFRRAHGGTIFLDEIGELPLHLQVRLLRVLQDRTVLPVGGTTPVSVDVRVVAATNRDLEALVREGKYREDLYYRLAVIAIAVPPLRERGEDVGRLIAHFLRRASDQRAKRIAGVSKRAMELLLRHAYPGNVRELENIIEHAATLADSDTIREVDLPEAVRGVAMTRAMNAPLDTLQASPLFEIAREDATSEIDARGGALVREAFASVTAEPHAAAGLGVVRLPVDEGKGGSLDEELERREKEMLLAALARAAGVKKRAATLLGINYRSFRHRLQKYGLDSHGDDVPPRGPMLPRAPGH